MLSSTSQILYTMTAMDFTMVSYNDAELKDRLSKLYPAVKDDETPLPKKWSSRDKFTYIALSQDDLKVQYRGLGKTHRDAASVRADHPIPASCGIYYFEATIISKGRDGYMGIGLSAQGVNLNRLPGWDKQSYGYHGDDGHSFCSTGTGQPYGPTFTTGDIVGCCVNLVDGSCFYTKNGVNIGIAFKDLPNIPLYPMVGLQTPREEVYANFGQHPFIFDIEDYIERWRTRTLLAIERLDVPDDSGQFQTILHRLVSTYLIHHGYAATAEAFGSNVDLGWGEHNEDLTSIRNRQKIQRLVLGGHLTEAIEMTQLLFPGLLEKKRNLLFLLKVRQFIEMINGTESEVKVLIRHASISLNEKFQFSSSPKHSSCDQSPTMTSPASSHNGYLPALAQSQPLFSSEHNPHFPPRGTNFSTSHSGGGDGDKAVKNVVSVSSSKSTHSNGSSTESDSEMETDSEDQNLKPINNMTNGDSCLIKNDSQSLNGESVTNGAGTSLNRSTHTNPAENGAMETENETDFCRNLCGGSTGAIRQMLLFGQQLLQFSKDLRKEYGPNAKNKRILEEAYSLLAYPDPWNSPVGHQLDPVQREPVCAALNSAILESQNLPKTPPLLMAIAHAQQCIRRMSRNNIGACAFASVSDYFR